MGKGTSAQAPAPITDTYTQNGTMAVAPQPIVDTYTQPGIAPAPPPTGETLAPPGGGIFGLPPAAPQPAADPYGQAAFLQKTKYPMVPNQTPKGGLSYGGGIFGLGNEPTGSGIFGYGGDVMPNEVPSGQVSMDAPPPIVDTYTQPGMAPAPAPVVDTYPSGYGTPGVYGMPGGWQPPNMPQGLPYTPAPPPYTPPAPLPQPTPTQPAGPIQVDPMGGILGQNRNRNFVNPLDSGDYGGLASLLLRGS